MASTTTRTNAKGYTVDVDATGADLYWRTGKGAHRHASAYCANYRRSIFTGDVTVIPADELAAWAPCDACCDDTEVAAATQAAAAKAAEKCRNSGVANPRRVMSTCRDCGKEGTVNRSTGALRAHKPAA